MKHRLFLWGLLVLAAGLMDAAVALRMVRSAGAPLEMFLGLASGQLALLAVWCVWGQKNWTWRLGATALSGAVLATPLSRSMAAPWSEWLALLYLHALLVGLLLVMVRAITTLCARLGRQDLGRQFDVSAVSRSFSLQGLFAAMVTVAIALAAARHVSLPWSEALTLLAYSACLATVAVTAVYVSASRHPLSLQMLILTGTCLLSGWLMSITEDAATAWHFTLIALVNASMIVTGMMVWRQSKKSLAASRSGT